MTKDNTLAAGIDTGKTYLDAALSPPGETLRVENTPEGHQVLLGWLLAHGVARVGIEASGVYSGAVVTFLRERGVPVAVFEPNQVLAFAAFKRQRVKNDKADAALIAQCVANLGDLRAPPDPRLAPLAEHLLFVEQNERDKVRLKTRLERYRGIGGDKRIARRIAADIGVLERRIAAEIVLLCKRARAHADLARRLELIESVRGIGLRTALTLLVLMPELGSISREQAASLAGHAPFDDDSGQRSGPRRAAGGRPRVRAALYAAAVPAAQRWNAALVELRERLLGRGKAYKVAIVACARKLLIQVNAVLARGTPWVEKAPARRAA